MTSFRQDLTDGRRKGRAWETAESGTGAWPGPGVICRGEDCFDLVESLNDHIGSFVPPLEGLNDGGQSGDGGFLGIPILNAFDIGGDAKAMIKVSVEVQSGEVALEEVEA